MKLTNNIEGIFIEIYNGLQIRIMKIFDKESGIELWNYRNQYNLL
jgi:hypothetical protein